MSRSQRGWITWSRLRLKEGRHLLNIPGLFVFRLISPIAKILYIIFGIHLFSMYPYHYQYDHRKVKHPLVFTSLSTRKTFSQHYYEPDIITKIRLLIILYRVKERDCKQVSLKAVLDLTRKSLVHGTFGFWSVRLNYMMSKSFLNNLNFNFSPLFLFLWWLLNK